MASLPGLEPPSTRSERSASPSMTSTVNLESYTQKQSTNPRSTARDPVLPDAPKSSLPLLSINKEPPAKHETCPDGNADASPNPSTSMETLPRMRPRKNSDGSPIPNTSMETLPRMRPRKNSDRSPIPSTSMETLPRMRPRKNLLQENKPLSTDSSDEEDIVIPKKRRKRKKKGASRRGRQKLATAISRTSKPPPRRCSLTLDAEENKTLSTDSSDEEDIVITKKRRQRKKKGASRRGRPKGATAINRTSKPPPRRRPLTWDARQNHFISHTDVTPKDDKKQTVNDLASQKDTLERVNGWKVFHLTTQADEVSNLEEEVQSQLSALQNFIEDKPAAVQMKPLDLEEEEILSKINALTEGSLQQSKIVQERVCQAKQQILKVLEHKPRIMEVIGRYKNKRSLRSQRLQMTK